MNYLLEGGNVFKDKNGQPLTQRIKQADIPGTIQWLEQVTGLDLTGEDDPLTGYPLKWLGSTGKKADSGDLDLAVDTGDISKPELRAHLERFAQSQRLDPRDFVRLSGEAVHFKTPILGNAKNGFVQTDFMFMPNLNWGTFFLAGGVDSAYKGNLRNILMSSIAKTLGLKVGPKGVVSRTTDQVISQDPDQAAEYLLGPGYTRTDLKNVETIYANLAQDPNHDVKLKDFREYLAREGIQEPQQSVAENEARLRDRIVNRGYVALVEAENPGVGGRAKGIEHLEDLVFRHGPDGIAQALKIVAHMEQTPGVTTAKWDGKPAVIWGRKPATGEFVLTDGSGFEAKGYDGLATSPAMMAQIQSQRSGERSGIIQLYRDLWPYLEASLPENFRGYVKGDLLYMQQPPVEAGNFVFQPNTTLYRIPVKSPLGQRIANSNVGIAVHSMYADQGEPRQPLSRVTFNPVQGLMLERPATPQGLKADPKIVASLKRLVRTEGEKMRTLFNPAELRAQQITDLFKLAVDFINTKVGTALPPANTLLSEFGDWLQGRVTPRKFYNIVEYLNSPASNTEALASAFLAFELLHELKMQLKGQADTQFPGQEGWVMATPDGYAKLVGRFEPEAFAALNRQRNNPQPVQNLPKG
jgi:hypothetical protein